jgi:hypothetical protein
VLGSAASFFLLARSHTLEGVIWGACLAQFACGITFPLLLTWASKLHFGVRAFGIGTLEFVLLQIQGQLPPQK